MQYAQEFERNGEDLSITAASKALKSLLKRAQGASSEALAKAVMRQSSSSEVVELVAATLPKLAVDDDAVLMGQPPFSADDLAAHLDSLAKKPGGLEDFAIAFAERVFLSGMAKPSKVLESTYALLCKVGKELVRLRELPEKSGAPKGTTRLDTLRAVDRELMQYVHHTEGIRSEDYSVLNQQHRVIAQAIRREEEAFLAAVPKSVMSKLESSGPVTVDEVSRWGVTAEKHIGKLLELGILHKADVGMGSPVIAYARAPVTSDQFETCIPPRLREKIGKELWAEFKLRYSGKLRPLGIAENRDDGVPTLNDRLRLKKVAEKCGVGVAHLVLALKYLESHQLVKVEHSGYSLSSMGMKAGLGMRAIRYVQRAAQHDGLRTDEVSTERYLDAVAKARERWTTPTYSLHTKDGGAPWVYLIDELYAGNARIDEKLVRDLINDIKGSDHALVIASNMLQGDPGVDPRAMRTSLKPTDTDGIDYRDYGAQLRFVRKLFGELEKPVLQLHGKMDLETANLRADVQRVRDISFIQGAERPDEQDVKAALGRLNEVTYRAGRKYNAKLQAEVLEFIVQIAMPLELKLGRQLMESHQVQEATGLDLNELEIVRDMVSELVRDADTGSTHGAQRINALYAEFLELPQVGGDEYLEKLKQVLLIEPEQLAAGLPVARGGGSVQFVSESGALGLRMVCLPEFRFGLSEAQNPTAKLVELTKSRTLGGRDMPDIIVAGATNQALVSMTAGGTLIVSAASLQSSNFDDSYLFTESQDRHKRRRNVAGGEASAGSIAFSGGIDNGIKTDAYTLRLWNRKIREVLEENARLGRPKAQVDIFATSDWQIGSPTAKPATMLRGLFWAVLSGKKEIVINGDAIQGQNYPRAPAEMQLTGLIGIEDQQAFIYALLNPVLDTIRRMHEADPTFEIPKFKILVGNHETNSQAHKGLQGTWFLNTIAGQLQSFYRGAFGPAVAESHVLYPKKFVDRMGVDVDYSHMVLDHTEATGFRIGVQHYVGIGAKGSSSVPPISAAKTWARSMENELRPLHGFLLGHWHTQSVAMADGLFYAIFGANADKSGFEWHLGYPTTVPASGVLRLYSDRPPELFFVTDPYLRLQEDMLREAPEYAALIGKHGSLEAYVEFQRQRHQRRDQGAMRYDELKISGAAHDFLHPHRKAG
jgi:hypothetical protein